MVQFLIHILRRKTKHQGPKAKFEASNIGSSRHLSFVSDEKYAIVLSLSLSRTLSQSHYLFLSSSPSRSSDVILVCWHIAHKRGDRTRPGRSAVLQHKTTRRNAQTCVLYNVSTDTRESFTRRVVEAGGDGDGPFLGRRALHNTGIYALHAPRSRRPCRGTFVNSAHFYRVHTESVCFTNRLDAGDVCLRGISTSFLYIYFIFYFYLRFQERNAVAPRRP